MFFYGKLVVSAKCKNLKYNINEKMQSKIEKYYAWQKRATPPPPPPPPPTYTHCLKHMVLTNGY
jgi:hypothetical protein